MSKFRNFRRKKKFFFGVEKKIGIQFRCRKSISFDWCNLRSDSGTPSGVSEQFSLSPFLEKCLRRPGSLTLSSKIPDFGPGVLFVPKIDFKFRPGGFIFAQISQFFSSNFPAALRAAGTKMSRFPLKETVFAVKTIIFFAALRAGGFICAQTQTQILAGGFIFAQNLRGKILGVLTTGGGV